jgi:hypothetical protein
MKQFVNNNIPFEYYRLQKAEFPHDMGVRALSVSWPQKNAIALLETQINIDIRYNGRNKVQCKKMKLYL